MPRGGVLVGRVTFDDGGCYVVVVQKIAVERKSRAAVGERQIPTDTGFFGCGGAYTVYQARQYG